MKQPTDLYEKVRSLLSVVDDPSTSTDVPCWLRKKLSEKLRAVIADKLSPQDILLSLRGFMRVIGDGQPIPDEDPLLVGVCNLTSLCEEFQ